MLSVPLTAFVEYHIPHRQRECDLIWEWRQTTQVMLEPDVQYAIMYMHYVHMQCTLLSRSSYSFSPPICWFSKWLLISKPAHLQNRFMKDIIMCVLLIQCSWQHSATPRNDSFDIIPQSHTSRQKSMFFLLLESLQVLQMVSFTVCITVVNVEFQQARKQSDK